VPPPLYLLDLFINGTGIFAVITTAVGALILEIKISNFSP